jgi:crotonobetainyl-CoA:carnitine CoA-transferase CaiB-like acyl-CoA transferase
VGGESVNYLAYNRSKKSMFLDYKSEEGRKIFFELVKTADVVVEQFRPNYLDKIGLGYEEAKKVNPKIIYVSVTGYGQTGPYAHLAGHDLNYIAYAGVLGITGEKDVQLADIAGGSYMSVIATLSALHARTQTGVGQHVDVSMTDTVMPLLSVSYAIYSATNQASDRGTLPLSGGMPNYGVYECKDKKYIALGTLEPKFWSKFCDLTNKPDWKMFMVPQNSEQLLSFKNLIGGLFLEKNQSEWVRFGLENDLLISPVYGLEDLENDPHLQDRQMIIETEHPTAGKLKSIGVPLKFSETEAKPSWAAPILGEDTEAILNQLGR